MTRIPSIIALLSTVALVFAGAAQDKQDKQDKKAEPQKKEAVFASSMDDAKYKEVIPGVTRATIWGDPDKGAYGAFTKFTAGANFALHTHTSDLRIVVLKGAYVYKPEGGTEQRVGVGQFLSVPGGTKHTSMGDTKDGAVFYEEGTGKFDLNYVEVKK